MGKKAKRERERGDEVGIACFVAALNAAESLGVNIDVFCARVLAEIAAMPDDTKPKKKQKP